MSVTHHIEELVAISRLYDGDYPWMQVGVFPVEDGDNFNWFNYTVGLGVAELWVSAVSIEGRGLGNEMAGVILNAIAAGWRDGALEMGDNVIVPLGVPDVDGEWERDADSIWWVATHKVPARSKGVNLTEAEWCVPIIWSSPLGWPEVST